jgi:hypothetical protein
MAYVKMWCVLLSASVAVYVVVGSWIFPDWWFGFFWDRKRAFHEIRMALKDLLNEHFRLTLLIVLFVFTVLISGTTFSRWLLPVTNRHAWVIWLAAVAIVVDALVVHHVRKRPYQTAMALVASLINVLTSLQDIRAVSSAHKIVPPIHFYYINAEAVEALHGQIEPTLKLTQRTEGNAATLLGKLTAGLLGLKIGIEAGKFKAAEDKLASVEFGVRRKCVDLMLGVSTENPAIFYSTEAEWYTVSVKLRASTHGGSSALGCTHAH